MQIKNLLIKNSLLTGLIILLTGCVSVPTILQGDYSSLTPTGSKQEHPMNVPVRWTGLVINTVNRKEKTCFEIAQTETNSNLRPTNIIPKNSSRFIACKEGFLEPHAFNKRLVTVTGNLVAYTKQNVDEYEYEYPVLKTDIIYIWRQSVPNYSYFNSFANFNYFNCYRSLIRGYCF